MHIMRLTLSLVISAAITVLLAVVLPILTRSVDGIVTAGAL
jgi:hypothetical protein